MSDKNADFEQEYTLKFKELALNFGEFLSYQRDQSVRDIGLHLKKKFTAGSKTASSVVFFQLKGKLKTTISKNEIKNLEHVSLKIEVSHLQQWHKYDTPTYLVVYLEAVDKFYYINIKSWIEKKYGPKILDEKKNTLLVQIPINDEHLLEQEAFTKMFIKGERLGWKNIVGDIKINALNDMENEELFEKCLYLHSLIRHIHAIEKNHGKVRVQVIDWQSKTRGEVHFYDPFSNEEVPEEKHFICRFDPENPFHSMWQYMFRVVDLENEYPFLNFSQSDEKHDELMDEYNDPYGYGIYVPKIEFKSGAEAIGEEASGELIEYDLEADLNPIGKILLKWIDRMVSAGLIDTTADCEFISVAPWHRKEV